MTKNKPVAATGPDGSADLRNIPLKDIIDAPGFNPRDEVGDVSELADMIRRNGLLNPITVTPAPGGKFYLIAGARRRKACGLVGDDMIACNVRDDVKIDDPKSLAMAMAENDGDGRQPLTPMQQARAYKRLFDMVAGESDTAKHKAIARLLGRSSDGAYQNIRVTLRLLELNPRVAGMLESGGISKWAAVTITELPSDVREGVAARVKPGMTENDIKRAALEVRREADGSADTAPSTAAAVDLEADDAVDFAPSKKKPTDRTAPVAEKQRPATRAPAPAIIIFRNKGEVNEKIEELVGALLDAEAEEDQEMTARCRERLAALLWVTGAVEEVNPVDRDFVQALKVLVAKAENKRASGTSEE